MPPKKTRILIGADDADSFDWLRSRVVRYGYEVDWARTASDGLAQLDEGPCAAILDLGMPDTGATRILRAIRDGRLPIKVAVVSGGEGRGVQDEAVMLRPDAWFTHPIDAIELMIWLKSVCPRAAMHAN